MLTLNPMVVAHAAYMAAVKAEATVGATLYADGRTDWRKVQAARAHREAMQRQMVSVAETLARR